MLPVILLIVLFFALQLLVLFCCVGGGFDGFCVFVSVVDEVVFVGLWLFVDGFFFSFRRGTGGISGALEKRTWI